MKIIWLIKLKNRLLKKIELLKIMMMMRIFKQKRGFYREIEEENAILTLMKMILMRIM